MEHSIEKAQLVEVIKIELDKGEGTEESPLWSVTQYWSLDGEMLVEKDDYLKPQTEENLLKIAKDKIERIVKAPRKTVEERLASLRNKEEK